MTEDEWLVGTDPAPVLAFLRDKVSGRKLRLFGCGCVRRVLHLLADESVSRRTLDFAERFADGLATRGELHGHAWGPPGDAFPAVLWDAFDAAETGAEFAAGRTRLAAIGDFTPWDAAFGEARSADSFLTESAERADEADEIERAAQVELARDIFGNPFRPVPFDPRWRTADVVALARGIYEDRAFDRLPLLADALMDAGCDSDDILAHCRNDGPHVRGCWVVDLVLGRE